MSERALRASSLVKASLCACLMMSLASCGGDGATAGGGATDGGNNGADAGTGGSDGGGGAPGDACQRASDCGLGLVCDAASGKCAAGAAGETCSSSDECSGGETCNVGYCGCGGQSYTGTATSVTPNVTIVIDRSTSMDACLTSEGAGCAIDKWGHAKAAVAEVLEANKASIRFGFGLYPGKTVGTCDPTSGAPGGVIVYPADGTADHLANINSSAQAAVLCRGTPIGDTLDVLLKDAALWDDGRPNHVLLLTDGEHNGSVDPVAAAAALLGHLPPVKTFVIGFDTGASARLSAIAVAGGTGDFYSAGSVAELSAAFDAIAGSVLGCSYDLSAAPPNPTELFVYAGNAPVARDTTHTNGWDYTDKVTYRQIQFYGAACSALQGGTVAKVTIVFGCPYE